MNRCATNLAGMIIVLASAWVLWDHHFFSGDGIQYLERWEVIGAEPTKAACEAALSAKVAVELRNPLWHGRARKDGWGRVVVPFIGGGTQREFNLVCLPESTDPRPRDSR